MVVSFIVDAGKVFDQNNKPTIKDTFYEVVIQGFATKNVVSFNKTELKTNSFNAKTFDLNDETIYTAKPLFTNQWLFDNRAKLFIGSLDQLTSINDFTLRNTSIKNPTSISINFDVAKNKLYDANGNLNSEITSFTIDITDFIIAKETYLETEYDASLVALDQYNVYEAKAIITPYFIFEHKDSLIKGNSEIKNQSDITNVNVSIIDDNGTNLETKTTNNGSEISDVSKIASTSVSVTFDVAANKVYDENGYISTETKQFATKIINLQKVGAEVSKSKFEEAVKKSGFNNFKNVSNKDTELIQVTQNPSRSNSSLAEEVAIIKYLEKVYKCSSGNIKKTNSEYSVTISSKTNSRCNQVFGQNWKDIISSAENLYLKNYDKDNNGNEKENIRQIVFRFELTQSANTDTSTKASSASYKTYELKPKSIQFFWTDNNKKPYWLSTNENSLKVDISNSYTVANQNNGTGGEILLKVCTSN